MRIDLMRVTPAWRRRALMFVIIPPAMIFTVVAEPIWAALKMLGELLSSCRSLPHTLGQIWSGRYLRSVERYAIYFPGKPY